jgi:hypothetical protein
LEFGILFSVKSHSTILLRTLCWLQSALEVVPRHSA